MLLINSSDRQKSNTIVKIQLEIKFLTGLSSASVRQRLCQRVTAHAWAPPDESAATA